MSPFWQSFSFKDSPTSHPSKYIQVHNGSTPTHTHTFSYPLNATCNIAANSTMYMDTVINGGRKKRVGRITLLSVFHGVTSLPPFPPSLPPSLPPSPSPSSSPSPSPSSSPFPSPSPSPSPSLSLSPSPSLSHSTWVKINVPYSTEAVLFDYEKFQYILTPVDHYGLYLQSLPFYMHIMPK